MRILIQPKFPSYDATSYKKATGKDAPWDPKKPLKAWFDPSPTDGVYFQLVFGPGNPTLQPFFAPDAGVVNLPPPVVKYPQNYVTPRTDAMISGLPGGTNQVPANSELFSSREDADELLAELRSDGIVNADGKVYDRTAENLYFPGRDGRRYFTIEGVTVKGPLSVNVQNAIIDKNSYGVGRPGKWTLVLRSEPTPYLAWLPSDLAPAVVAESVPIPYPPIPPGTHLESFMAGDPSSTYVVSDEQPTTGGSGGGFAEADRATLNGVSALLKKLGERFGL